MPATQVLKKRNKQQYKSAWQDVHGLFLLNKPQGITSNQALQKVRKIFNAKKAGHTGSLDPMATGLLPCCFGDATKIAGLMLNADKIYLAECEIGCETDTGDATGTMTNSSDKIALSEEEIKQATAQLTGKIQQIPPMYSALHHNGQRLYDLARKGIEVERKPRTICIHEFKLLKIDNSIKKQRIAFQIHVSKGTYIRTLLEDFAKICGTYAHMIKLHRTKLGVLTGDMMTLELLQQEANPHDLLQSMDIALVEYDKITVDAQQKQTLINGLRLNLKLDEKIYRIYDEENKFLGLGEALANGQFKVKRLFLKSYSYSAIKHY
ncbi:MAG TPA: tRNA pseudouridine(55) synthase TruB [Oceanospirillales bacterium]|nr:tRNA pseudouridine(55) synthase TruB [Oceanospirillales bacterium]